jgi:hypothetical protein
MHVYVIRDNLGRVKVGITNNPPQRFNTIKNATGITVMASYVSKDTKKARIIENYLLNCRFKKIRKNGEWLQTDDITSVYNTCLEIVQNWTN